MSRLPLALVFGSAALAADTPASAPPVEVPAATVSRAVPPTAAELLKAALPKSAFVKPPEKKPDAVAPVVREAAKPAGDVVNLPKFVVRDAAPPTFTERQLAPNPKALAAIAMRRYFTETDRAMNRFMLPLFSASANPHCVDLNSNECRALEMYYEDERLKNMSEVDDLANMVVKSRPASKAKLQDLSHDLFIRRPDFGWQPDKR